MLEERGMMMIKANNDESLNFFKKLRDVSDAVVKAYEDESGTEDEQIERLESAMGRFIMLMMEMDALK
jgi:hypothetical protein